MCRALVHLYFIVKKTKEAHADHILPVSFFTVTQQRASEGNRVTHERMWLTFIGFPLIVLYASPDQRKPVWLSLGGEGGGSTAFSAQCVCAGVYLIIPAL